jgi:hypothetical protein
MPFVTPGPVETDTSLVDRSMRLTLPRDTPAHEFARLLFDHYRANGASSVPRFRTIAVLGAGVSNAACGLKLGKDLATDVEQSLLDAGMPPQRFEQELRKLEEVNHLLRTDFETRMVALSNYDRDLVRKVLCEKCDVSHYPSLTYELVAHLLKHGFLDAVVNFNFDELLDETLENEVGAKNFTRIVRDGEWSRRIRAQRRDGRSEFERPIYIKPHGTASEPASLRFTREDYFTLPKTDTGRLLEILMTGAPAQQFISGETNSAPGVPLPVSVLVLGYRLANFEFIRLLNRSPAKSRIYITRFGDNRFPVAGHGWSKEISRFAKDRYIRIPATEHALDDLMQGMWNAIEDQAAIEPRTHSSLSVRGIARHELIAHLFQAWRRGTLLRRDASNLSPDQQLALENYLKDRLVVEITLAIAKAKGFVDARVLADGRAGHFSRLINELPWRKAYEPLTWYLEQLGMKRRNSSLDAYWHSTVPDDSKRTSNLIAPNKNAGHPLTVDDVTFKRTTCEELATQCEKLLTDHRQGQLSRGGGRELLRRTLNEMFEGDDVEIVPALPENFRNWFPDARAIRTLAELRYVTRLLLKGSWQMLLCVAESGEWLLEDPVRRLLTSQRRAVGMIAADAVYSDELQTIPRLSLRQLPWHLHNKHMTIRLAENEKGEPKPDLAIYFERHHRSTAISPLLLTSDADLQRALDKFTEYWLKAQRYGMGASETVMCSPEELAGYQRSMLLELSRFGAAIRGGRAA